MSGNDQGATGRDVHVPEGVAIVGMAGRFPGAEDVGELWRNLRDGVESVERLSDEQLEASGVAERVRRQEGYVPAASPLDDVASFDAGLFGFNPREAELMDPQQRLFLECAWEALETAGYAPGETACRVGVYAGSRMSDYLLFHLATHPRLLAASGSLRVLMGNDKDYLATLTAYKLDLRGPGLGVQTACSTSLVAVHLACEAILGGECDMALAGGVTVRLPQRAGYTYLEGGILSRDGHCRAFDADATGTVFGSGVGVVVLKRLADALADGDNVLAVVRGSAINNDGSLKVGFTAPGVRGQEEVIAEALEVAGVDADSIGYVEAHGTGTPMGDPIEIEALTRAYRRHTDRRGYCAVGSVKSNFGHLEAAAGVAGLMKATLALGHRQIPPSLHFSRPNPRIDFAASPFFVNDRLRPWETEGRLRAGVSSFGIGGTNAHLILEEAPPPEPAAPAVPGWRLLTLSARSAAAADRAVERLADHLDEAGPSPASLADVAYTLRVGRRDFPHRRTVVARDRGDAVAALRGEGGRLLAGVAPEADPGVAFLFPGQGSQHPGMGRDLHHRHPLFRDTVDRCAELLTDVLGVDLRQLLFPPPGEEEAAAATLTDTRYAQPALFVVEYALARLWTSWGVEPRALLGHSVGEYAAACLAGVFDLPDALSVVAARGEILGSLPGGDMLAVSLDADDLAGLLPDGVEVAAVNAPRRVVASGPAEGVETLARRLEGRGVEHRRLHTSHAFHSAMMEPALETFRRRLEGVALAPPRIPVVSNVTGRWLNDEEATDPEYWVRQVRRPVRFGPGVESLVEAGVGVFLEVGPGRSLASPAREAARPARPAVIASMPHPRSAEPGAAALLQAAGRVWLAGVPISDEAVGGEEGRRRVPLPTYPFERRRYWLERRTGGSAAGPAREGGGFYLPAWNPAPPPVAEVAEDAAPPPRTWLLLADGGGLADEVAARLAARGHHPVRLLAAADPDSELERLPDDAVPGPRYRVTPGLAGALPELFRRLGDEAAAPSRVLHLWCHGAPSGDEMERGFHTLHDLAVALAGGGEAVRLVVGASRLFAVAAGEPVAPRRAPLLGPCRVLGQEDTRLAGRAVDLPEVASDAGSPALGELAEQVLAEAEAGDREPWVAYRGGRRWLRRFVAAEVPSVEGEGAASGLRRGGVYLITGGLGAIGLELAEELAARYGARLVLTGRRRVPSRDGWAEAAAAGGEAGRLAQRLARIESRGGRVEVKRADAADRDAMSRVLESTLETFGGLDGVFHLAGVAGRGLLARKSRFQAEEVLRPKVKGAPLLTELLAARAREADAPSPFLLLASSTLSLVGGPGQGDYAAANAFLAALAEHRAAAGGPRVVAAVSGGWEVGMAATGGASRLDHPLLTSRLPAAAGRVYGGELDPALHWVLSEHRVLGHPVLPGTALLELAVAAYQDGTPEGGVELRQAGFRSPLVVPDGERRRVEVRLEPAAEEVRFRVRSQPSGEVAAGEMAAGGAGSGGWVDHASGSLAPLAGEAPRNDLAAIRERCREEVDVPAAVREDAAGRVVTLGPRWDVLRRSWTGPGEALAELELGRDSTPEAERYALHPALLDVATSFALASLAEGHFLPLSYGRLRLWRTLPARLFSHLRRHGADSGGADSGGDAEVVTLDVTLMDPEGREVAAVENLVLRRLRPGSRPAEALAPDAGAGPAAEGAPPDAAAGVAAAAPSGLAPGQGVEALLRVLGPGLGPVVCFSAGDLPAQIEAASEPPRPAVDAADQGGGHERPDMATPYLAPRNEVERTLADLWQRTLGLSRVGVHDSFFELGGDSLLALRLVAQIQELYSIELPVGQLFDTPTVAGLAEGITARLAGGAEDDELARMLAEMEDLSDAEVEALLAEEETLGESMTEEEVDG